MSDVVEKNKPLLKNKASGKKVDNSQLAEVKTLPSAKNIKDKKQDSIEKHVRHVQSFETSRIRDIESSKKVAWRIAIAACLMTALSWIAIVLMLPLRHIETHVIRVDESTGAIDIVTPSNEVFISNNEALDNYWISRFLQSYESYSYFTIQKDYDTVGALTSLNVAEVYQAKWEGRDALHTKYKDRLEVSIEIISMIPTGEGIRTVRFTRITKDFLNDNKNNEESLVATIGYKYERTLNMTGAQRLVNPIGFNVVSYRVDEEIN